MWSETRCGPSWWIGRRSGVGAVCGIVQRSRVVPLAAWPVPAGRKWVSRVNRVETEAELTAVRRSVVRGTPFGEAAWLQRTARRLCLESTLRSQGRPKKEATRQA